MQLGKRRNFIPMRADGNQLPGVRRMQPWEVLKMVPVQVPEGVCQSLARGLRGSLQTPVFSAVSLWVKPHFSTVGPTPGALRIARDCIARTYPTHWDLGLLKAQGLCAIDLTSTIITGRTKLQECFGL
jgi:hypothetical protein